MVSVTTKTSSSSKHKLALKSNGNSNNDNDNKLQNNQLSVSSSWQDIPLWSPPSSYNIGGRRTPVPSAARLEEDDDFSLNSPTTPFSNPHSFFFSSSSPKANNTSQKRRGYLYEDHQHHQRSTTSSNTKLLLTKTLACMTLVWCLGAVSWNALQSQVVQQQDDLLHTMATTVVTPPPGSPSDLARRAFAKHYGHHHNDEEGGPQDWNAHPPLYVMLESLQDDVEDGLHSFTDDTSMAYQEGEEFVAGLSQHLSSLPLNTKVRVTSYYSLLEQGLDYVAQNMVTPDGSHTVVQIQYTILNLGDDNEQQRGDLERRVVQQLQQRILDYGAHHAAPLQYLEPHYTGLYWNPTKAVTTTTTTAGTTTTWKAYTSVVAAVAVTALLLASLVAPPTTDTTTTTTTFLQTWMLWTVVSTSTAVSISAMALAYVLLTSNMTVSSSIGLGVMVLVSLALSLYYSFLQTSDQYNFSTGSNHHKITAPTQVLPSVLVQNASLLLSFAASLYMVPCPTVQSISLGASTAVLFTTVFHGLVASHAILQGMTLLLMKQQHQCHHTRKITSPLSRSSTTPPTNGSSTTTGNILRWATTLGIILGTFSLAFVSVATPRKDTPGRMDDATATDMSTAINQPFQEFGELFGYGRLTPYRILFDGHKAGQSMISLAGYDIVQTITDELMGIYIPETTTSTDQDDDDEDMVIPAGSGSTHIAEGFAESQHLIKNLIDTLQHFKSKQQKEFDRHHQRRQEQWEHLLEQQLNEGKELDRKLQQEEDNSLRYDRTLNSGVDATTYTGLAVLENARIPQALYSSSNICRDMEPRCPSEALHLLNVIEDETTTSDKLATYVTVNLGVDPFSKKGMEWLQMARETVRRVSADPRIVGGVEIHIDGPAAIVYDHLQEQAQQEQSHEQNNSSTNWWQFCPVLGFLVFALGVRIVALSKVADGSRKPKHYLDLQPLGTHSSAQHDAYLAQYDQFVCSPGAP